MGPESARTHPLLWRGGAKRRGGFKNKNNMTACSFLPAATQMIYDMNLQHLLHGITFECPPVALAEKNKVVRCVLEGKCYSSVEIDKIFSASKAQGKSLYYVDEELLAS